MRSLPARQLTTTAVAAAAATLGALMAAPALAQDSSYFYGGVSFGQARAKIDESLVANSVLTSETSSTVLTRDERDNAWRLFGGWQFNRYLGLEGGYFDLGKNTFGATTSPTGTLDGTMRVRGVNLDLVATMPVTENLSALARVGAAYGRTHQSFSTTGAATVGDSSPSESATNVKYGIGLQYAFSPNFIVRGEAERYRVSDALGGHPKINTFMLSLVMPIGRAPARVVAQAPTYTSPALATIPPVAPPPPAPEPVVVQAPVVVMPVVPPPAVVPERRRVTYSAESMFTFDQSEVRAEGKAALDGFARELEGTRFEMITVTGHTDRLGSEAYNQTLSQQRAEAVKQYLVTTDRVDPMKITASGKSETEPVTKPDDCKGKKAGTALIACLQPDRRVEIEVIGTR